MATKRSDFTISRELSYLLRHGAEKAGLEMGSDGYVRLADILARRNFAGVTAEDIQRVVTNNDKQRFRMEERVCPETNESVLYIKATQGHTLKVADLSLIPITTINMHEYPVVVHGTYKACLPSIQRSGLSRMSRQHIHFAIGEPEEDGVISGMRKTAEIMIYINLPLAISEGIPFFISENKVILSPGDEHGYLSSRYFQRVVQR